MQHHIVLERPSWVQPVVAAQMTGYTEKAIKEKVKQGKLIEGVHFQKAPDNRIIINWRRFEEWMCGS
ncbi:hypothetical protein [Aeromonas jandaei]|uniref:hypothetical protein n=1 Tax=Aeromonas jandaei TaxID=650 RepID=UPI003BA026B9